MSSPSQDAELLRLAQELLNEAEAEHVNADHVECPACWKAHMANVLWSKVTGRYEPHNYLKDHRITVARVNFKNVYPLHRRRSVRAA